METSPSSFTTIAVSAKRGSPTSAFSSVVFPVPRKPVSDKASRRDLRSPSRR